MTQQSEPKLVPWWEDVGTDSDGATLLEEMWVTQEEYDRRYQKLLDDVLAERAEEQRELNQKPE